MLFKTSMVVAVAGLLVAGASVAEARNRGKLQCYLWASNASPTLNVPYTPVSDYSFNTKRNGAITVTKTGTGRYTVRCGGVGGGAAQGPGGHVQVTAYGSGSNTFCHVGSWVTGGDDFSASVYCFSAAGGAADDSNFTLLFMR